MTRTVLVVEDDLRLRTAFARAIRVPVDLKLAC
jgi:hypothetical protein